LLDNNDVLDENLPLTELVELSVDLLGRVEVARLDDFLFLHLEIIAHK
jgi:hypothetical protein